MATPIKQIGMSSKKALGKGLCQILKEQTTEQPTMPLRFGAMFMNGDIRDIVTGEIINHSPIKIDLPQEEIDEINRRNEGCF